MRLDMFHILNLTLGLSMFCLAVCGRPYNLDLPLLGAQNKTEVGPVAMITFLRRFGYLPFTNYTESETIYDSKTVVEAIKLMQTYAGLLATGILDNQTLALLSRGRCGVPDVEPSSANPMELVKEGLWQKRKITYSFENWLPNAEHDEVENEMRKAFDIWSPYSQLSFKQINHDYNSKGDIVILFARGQHGDRIFGTNRFAFDGPGNILAHAYLPYGNGQSPLDGDIHFDADEEFSMIPIPKNGWYFLAVASHEIGHSLGLSHSSDMDSIMFPYYRQSMDPKLGHSDIMNLYTKYIQRTIPNDDDDDKSVEQEDEGKVGRESTTTSTRRTTTLASISPTTKRYTNPTTTDHTEPEGPNKDPDLPDTAFEKDSDEDLENSDYKPNICKNNFDTLAFLRNELFVFKGKYMWRLQDKGTPGSEYPTLISRLFPALANVGNIDAAFERNSDGALLFFSGNQYWIFDGTSLVAGSPKLIQELGLPSSLAKIDGVFAWEKNRMTYFFSDDKYWRYNETIHKMDENYPENISRWGGIPPKISAVITWKDEKAYFFKDNVFWRFDDTNVYVEDNFPLDTKQYWFHC